MVDLNRYYTVKGKGDKKKVVRKKIAKEKPTVFGSKEPEESQKNKDTISQEPLSKKELEELRNGIMKHPALELFSDEARQRILFGDIEWPTEFDKFIPEDPKPDEFIISQTAWLAKASAYIAMHLKRWIEENLKNEYEIRQWYTTVINPFTYRMIPIKQPCEDILNVLPARLLNFQQRFNEKYEQLLSVAKKADEEKVYALDTSINNFKLASKNLYDTTMQIHSEAFIMLEKLTKPVGGEAGDTDKSADARQNTRKILGDKLNLWGLEINWRVLWDKLKKLMTNLKTFLHRDK